MKNDNPSKTLDCIIVDDEEASVSELQRHLAVIPSIRVVSVLTNPEKAVTEIVARKPDLVFLDIQMPGSNGFDIVAELHETTAAPFIIFVTAYDKFAIQAIRASAFDFLLKPVIPAELALAVDRAMKKLSEESDKISYTALLELTLARKIRFNSTGGFVLVHPDDILYVQADWNYSEIHFSREKFEMVTLNLGAVEDMLPHDTFVRINRGTLINLRYLDRVNRRKRICILKKEDEVVEFNIPLLRIRYLEDRL
jgi:two-component system LytT family response regulator